jgi:hypothetical protein
MAYLLTAGVLAFQIAILVTILGAARISRRSLNLVSLGWVAFTLFGSIFTAGLLLLQLLTICVAYAIGRGLKSKKQFRSTPSTTPKPKSDGWALFGLVVIVGVVTGKMMGRESAQHSLERVQEIRAANTQQPQAQSAIADNGPVMLDSQTMITKTVADATSTTYYLKMVDVPSSSLDQQFLANAQELIGRRNCADSDIRSFYDQGQYMKYVVAGSDDRKVVSFIISKVY